MLNLQFVVIVLGPVEAIEVVLLGMVVVTVGWGGIVLFSFLVTLNPADIIPMPDDVDTVTNLDPTKAWLATTIFAVICVSLFTVKLVTSIPVPKDTLEVPVKFAPVRVTLVVVP